MKKDCTDMECQNDDIKKETNKINRLFDRIISAPTAAVSFKSIAVRQYLNPSPFIINYSIRTTATDTVMPAAVVFAYYRGNLVSIINIVPLS